MEPKLANTVGLKTYSRSKCWKVLNPKDNKSEPLTTKVAVKYLLQGSLKRRVCRFCLTATTSLSELDEILEVGSSGAIFQVTIRDMIASFYPFQVGDDPNFPSKICSKCLDRTINCYLFTQQCERAERALRNCFIDINEKFDKLDPLERVKRRGRQKLNPNYNILHVEHKKVINYAEPIINIVNVGASLETGTDGIEEIKELECPKCWQVFTNVESLLNHEKIHPKSMWYNCRLCGKSFVKHSHYKKHMKQFHVKEEKSEICTDKQHFQCNECGSVIKELENYYQHIEKHKFKNVLEHLVEKKMDSLCGVCLDKGDGMVELNETLSLHGGYPELSGEMTMATVLTATIPEKTHKYEELLVSKEANRVKIAKKNPKAAGRTKINQDVNKKAVINTDGVVQMKFTSYNTFSFSNPIKITDNFDLVQEVEDIDQTDGCLKIDQIDSYSMFKMATCVDNTSNGTQVKYGDTGVDFPFSFSNPLKISDNSCGIKNIECKIDRTQTNDTKQVECIELECSSGLFKTPILCIICSIFKKAQCEKCIEKASMNNTVTNAEMGGTQMKSCKMCWIFSKVGVCNYCKNPVDTQIDDNKPVKIKDVFDNKKLDGVVLNQERNIEPEMERNIQPERQKSIELEGVTLNRKRKIESESAVPNRKRKTEPGLVQTSKWQCEICLTNNDNRERCFCCGEKKKKENSTQFSFTFAKYDYAPKYNDIIEPEQVTNNNYISKNNNEVNVENIKNIQDDKEEDKTVETVGNYLISNIYVPNIEVQIPSNVESEANANQIKPQVEEQMDVYFDDCNEKIDGNIAKFDGNVKNFDGNVEKFDGNVDKVSPAIQMMNIDEETSNITNNNTTFIPPIVQSFSPTLVVSPQQYGFNFNIGSQDDDKKHRKMLKSMRHKRDRYGKN